MSASHAKANLSRHSRAALILCLLARNLEAPQQLGRWSVPFFRSRDRLLDRHRFRSLGKLVVGNLDRIADVHNIGN